MVGRCVARGAFGLSVLESLRRIQQIAFEAALLWSRMYGDLIGGQPTKQYERLFAQLDSEALAVRGEGARKAADRLHPMLVSLAGFAGLARSRKDLRAAFETHSDSGLPMLAESIAVERRKFNNLMKKLDPEWRPVPMIAFPEGTEPYIKATEAEEWRQ